MKYKNPLLALLAGLLLWAAWPVSPFTFLIFVAWVPLLIMAEMPRRKGFFGLLYLSMLTWNLLATWWIWYATQPGAAGAFLVNSLLMCLPWIGYRKAARAWGAPWSYLALVAFWMAFEYIHLQDWGLSWPWLTLGNVFATHPNWVQWYEYTGTSGGTLWILAVNILVYHALRKNSGFKIANLQWRKCIPVIAALFLPFLLSLLVKPGASVSAAGTKDNVVVVQPNIDPYEKLYVGSLESQLFNLVNTSQQLVDSNTRLLVWPETALYSGNGFDEEELKGNFLLNPLWGFLRRHPQLKLFTGIESYRNTGDHYEAYNGSVVLDSSGALQFYHKSMLVPGAETLPGFLKFLAKWFDKFGGTTGGYTKQKDRTVLLAGKYAIAPAICYESIYGEFMSRYAYNGANIICVITNDGWWRNTPGHKQHMNYARLRAIETRKWVVRSANTGISCFIDPQGKVYQPQPYGTRAAIKQAVQVQAGKTFYVRYRDLLSKLACIIAIAVLGGLVWRRFRKPKPLPL